MTSEIQRQIRNAETINYVPAGTAYLACDRCSTVRPLLPHLAIGGALAAGDQCSIPLGPEGECSGRLFQIAAR